MPDPIPNQYQKANRHLRTRVKVWERYFRIHHSGFLFVWSKGIGIFKNAWLVIAAIIFRVGWKSFICAIVFSGLLIVFWKACKEAARKNYAFYLPWILVFGFPFASFVLMHLKQKHILNTVVSQIATNMTTQPQIQWYLKIDDVQYIKLVPNALSSPPPFRLEAVINSQKFSFPISEFFIKGLQDERALNQSYPIQHEEDKYSINFLEISLKNDFLNRHSDDSSNVLNFASERTEMFEVKQLPCKGTNTIPVSMPNADQSVGKLEIIYEITNN